VKELAVRFGKDHSLVGILTDNGKPILAQSDDVRGVLLLGAGYVHRVGPNRIYVKIARQLAAKGFVVLRFDFSGIGDSGARRDKLPAIESVVDEARQALDYVEGVNSINQFCVMGLCTGATAVAQISMADTRIRKAILINPQLPRTNQGDLLQEVNYYQKQAFFNPRSWLRLFLMKSNYRDISRMIWFEIKSKIHSTSFSSQESTEMIAALKMFFKSMRHRQVELLIISSGNDIGEDYYRRLVPTEYRSLKKSGLLSTRNIMRADHAITSLACQEELIKVVLKWMLKTN
jgi:hypothetical protein